MQKNPGHQPQRFEEYTQLPDGKGFTIKDTNHVFYYDRYGGWKDQYRNYYNQDGLADQEPDSASQKSISQGSWSYEEDQFEQQFGPSTDVQEEFQKQPLQSQVQLAIAKNIALLDQYIKQEPLRVNFQIVDEQDIEELPNEKQLLQGYKKKVKEIINVFYEDKNSGYFVVSKKSQALHLINLEGQNVVGVDITFQVQPFEEFLHDPLSQLELQSTLPKFVDVNNGGKIYTIHLQNHTGFADKKKFKQWTQKAKKSLTQFEIVKMRANQKKEKIPVVKILVKQVQVLKSIKYDNDKQVTIEEYKPLNKQEQVNQQTHEKVQALQIAKLQKKQEQTQQSTKVE